MSTFKKNQILGKQLLTDRSVTSLVKYFEEIATSKYDPLNTQEEYDLFVEYYKTKDKRIKDKILNSNVRFVVTVAKSFLRHDMLFTNEKAVLEDVINAGNVGMIIAFDKYDHTKGFKFLTFATWYIRLYASSYLNETLADIRLPSNLFRIEKDINKAIALLKSEDDILEPSIYQIVDKYNNSKDKVSVKMTSSLLCDIRDNKKPFISANRTLAASKNDSDDMLLQDTFSAESKYDPDNELINESKQQLINSLLNKKLNERELLIVEYTFGLNGKEEKTPEQISILTDLTRERVGQLLKGAINKLKENKSSIKSILS